MKLSFAKALCACNDGMKDKMVLCAQIQSDHPTLLCAPPCLQRAWTMVGLPIGSHTGPGQPGGLMALTLDVDGD